MVFDKLRYGSFVHDYNYWRKNRPIKLKSIKISMRYFYIKKGPFRFSEMNLLENVLLRTT
jgi:hypothetical protein